MTTGVRLEGRPPVAVIRLDRPPVNAINKAMHGELRAVTREIAERREFRAAVIYGGERAFCGGADIQEMAALDNSSVRRYGDSLSSAVESVAALPIPVMAAITGYALGGGLELALTADFRFIAENATAGLPEIKLGVIPGAGGTQRLTRLIGIAGAKLLIYGGTAVTSAQAVDMGLCLQRLPAGEVFSTAMKFATQLAGGATLAIGAAKRAIDGALDGSLKSGLRLEQRLFADLFGSHDQQEGMAAFLTRGQPTFTGQ